MGPVLRKTILTIHVLSSVGWFGAVAAFLVLAAVGLGTEDAQLLSAVYLASQLTTRWVIVPFAILSLLSGVIQGLGTQWGLVKYWWVLIKLILTLGSVAILFLHTGVIDQAAAHWGDASASHQAEGMAALRLQLVVDSAAALVVLAIATALSTVKPRGQTPFAFRRRSDSTAPVLPDR